MSTGHDEYAYNRKLARHSASILFVLLMALGYAVPPQVEGADASPAAAEELHE